LLEIAQGFESEEISSDDQSLIVEYFTFIAAPRKLTDLKYSELHEIIQPEAMFERFAYYHSNGIRV